MKKAIDFSWEDNPIDVSAEVNFIWHFNKMKSKIGGMVRVR